MQDLLYPYSEPGLYEEIGDLHTAPGNDATPKRDNIPKGGYAWKEMPWLSITARALQYTFRTKTLESALEVISGFRPSLVGERWAAAARVLVSVFLMSFHSLRFNVRMFTNVILRTWIVNIWCTIIRYSYHYDE